MWRGAKCKVLDYEQTSDRTPRKSCDCHDRRLNHTVKEVPDLRVDDATCALQLLLPLVDSR